MTFDPTTVPAGCIYRPVPFLLERPVITPRSVFAHTMAARKRSTVQSAWNHANAAPNQNTLPHYALGLDEADGCAKFLPTNRRGIATTTVSPTTKNSAGNLIWPTLTEEQRSSIRAHGNVRDWAIGIETADTGSDADPGISAFTDYQLEMLTRIYVHELQGWGIPAVKLPAWYSTGMATHTDPFEFPYTTIYKGKICPGSKKKAQFWNAILPEVQRRLTPTPPPVPEPPPVPPPSDLEVETMLPAIGKTTDGSFLAQFAFRGPIYKMGDSPAHDVKQSEVFGRGGGQAFDIVGQAIVNPGEWSAVKAVETSAQVRARMGATA